MDHPWIVMNADFLQGFMGWYMVKSGLDPQIVENRDVPRVSQYRLAAHLSLAFFIYVLMLKEGLAHLWPRHLFPIRHAVTLALPDSMVTSIFHRAIKHLPRDDSKWRPY
jgi:heme A synthase